jgi:hypothetical protein
LELQPGDELPEGFSFAGAIIDVHPEPVVAKRPGNPSQGEGASTTDSDAKLVESVD